MTWQTDVQANILRGLPARHARYLFLEVDDEHASELVRVALPHVRTSGWQRDHFPRGTTAMGGAVLNLAFTRAGLERAAGTDYIADERRRGAVTGDRQGADAFAHRRHVPVSHRPGATSLDADAVNSMYRRLDLLGEAPIVADDGEQLRHSWTWDPRRQIHVLAWISGPDEQSIAEIETALLDTPGVGLVHALGAEADPRRLGPFGFVDGTNQPAIEGFHSDAEMAGRGAWTQDGWRGVRPGEFILGELDEGDERRFPQPAILHNGTFLVFRQIQVWPERFDDLVSSQEAATGASADEIASWFVGRNRPIAGNEGTSLMVDGHRDQRDFLYGRDPEGLRCPLGAHVRRANPRDSMGRNGHRVIRHRIIRRGMPYSTTANGTEERGLAFIALQARIEDQFEFVQASWLNSGPTLHVGEDPDPIAGYAAIDVQRPRFVRQGSPSAVIALPRPEPFGEPLTAVRGGEYFVMPAIDGLRELAETS